MAVDVIRFRARFPEFRGQDSAIIAACLDDAAARIHADRYGEQADTAVLYLAAHLLATSPYGEFARLDPKKEPDGALTVYERELRRIREQLLVLPTGF